MVAESPSYQEYKSALQALRQKNGITEKQLLMLNVHYCAPGQSITPLQLAQAVGNEHNYQMIRAQYDKLAQELWNELKYPHEAKNRQWLSILALVVSSKGRRQWILKEQVTTALDELGWFDKATVHAQVTPQENEQATFSGNAVTFYELAWELQDNEANRFWERNNAFLLLHAGLLAVITATSAPAFYQRIVSLAGIILALIWLLVSQQGKLYVYRWNKVLDRLEDDYKQILIPLHSLYEETKKTDPPPIFSFRWARGETTDLMRRGIYTVLAAWSVVFLNSFIPILPQIISLFERAINWLRNLLQWIGLFS